MDSGGEARERQVWVRRERRRERRVRGWERRRGRAEVRIGKASNCIAAVHALHKESSRHGKYSSLTMNMGFPLDEHLVNLFYPATEL